MAQFLSPDPFIQAPRNWFNYNRYGYCLNNPLMYSDPSGNFFGLFTAIWLTYKAIKSADHSASAIKGTAKQLQGTWKWTFNGANMSKMDPTINYKQLINSYKIDIGEIMTSPTEKLQGMVGNAYSHFRNMTGHVTNVELGPNYVLVNDRNDSRWGATLGVYINAGGIRNDYKHDPLFVHTIQSKILGSLYMSKVAIPSGISQGLDKSYGKDFHNHDNTWFEINANQFGQIFFDPHYKYAGQKKKYSTSFKNVDLKWFLLFNPVIF